MNGVREVEWSPQSADSAPCRKIVHTLRFRSQAKTAKELMPTQLSDPMKMKIEDELLQEMNDAIHAETSTIHTNDTTYNVSTIHRTVINLSTRERPARAARAGMI